MGRPRSRWWLGLGILGLALLAGLVWLAISRLPGQAPNAGPVARPASVPPPYEAQPVAIWPETTEPLTNLHGDLRLGYEKLPSLKRDALTVRVSVELLDPNGAFRPAMVLHFHRPMAGQSGQLALGALLGAFGDQQPVSPPLSGQGQLVISVGDRKEGEDFRRLSNDAVVPCVFEAGEGQGGRSGWPGTGE